MKRSWKFNEVKKRLNMFYRLIIYIKEATSNTTNKKVFQGFI